MANARSPIFEVLGSDLKPVCKIVRLLGDQSSPADLLGLLRRSRDNNLVEGFFFKPLPCYFERMSIACKAPL